MKKVKQRLMGIVKLSMNLMKKSDSSSSDLEGLQRGEKENEILKNNQAHEHMTTSGKP